MLPPPDYPEEVIRGMREYAEHLLGLGLSPSTVRVYRSLMRKAAAWAHEARVDLANPSPSDLAKLREQYVESAATLRQLRCALQHYWDWKQVHPQGVKALRVPKKPRPNYRGLDFDDARRLAQTAVGWHPEGTATLIGLYTGLRRSEIAAMRWDRFSHDFSEYRVLGKGLVTRTVPIVPALAGILRPLRSGYVWVFPGESRLHVTPTTVWQWIVRVSTEAGVRVTPHQLRHTAANRLLQSLKAERNPEALRIVQAFLGHARIETTEIYVQGVTPDEIAEAAVNALDWLGPRSIDYVA